MLATWCAPGAPTLVSRLQICGGIVIQAAEWGNWTAVHGEHSGHTAAKFTAGIQELRLAWDWTRKHTASGHRETRWSGCDYNYTSIWPNASLTYNFTVVHWGLLGPVWAPVGLEESFGFSLTTKTMCKTLKLRSLHHWTISCGNCDGNSQPACHNPS